MGITNVKVNPILFECKTPSEQVDEDSDSSKTKSTSYNSDDERQIDIYSLQICGPNSVLKDGICVEETTIAEQAMGRISDIFKNNIAQWAKGSVGNSDFIDVIRSLVYDNIIDFDGQTSTAKNEYVPQWFQHTSSWWSEGLISEDEFINAVKYLIKKEIIRI